MHIRKRAAILKEQEVLNSFGITGGNYAKMTPEEVREGFALWIVSNNRAFSQVNDSYVSRLLTNASLSYSYLSFSSRGFFTPTPARMHRIEKPSGKISCGCIRSHRVTLSKR